MNEQTASRQPIRVHRYPGDTREHALERFQSDANDAAAAGYEVLSQTWDDDGSLLVTYRLKESGASQLFIPAAAIVTGGVLVALGSLLPWVTAVGGFGISVSRSGIEGGDGLITIVLGIGVALLGLTMIRGENRVRWAVTLIASVVALILLVADYFLIEQRIRSVAEDGLVVGSVGIGLWVAGIGALIAAVGALQTRPAGTR